MNEDNVIKLSSFNFNITVLRAEETDDGKRYLYGIASSTSEDKYRTIFNENCQNYFVEQCVNNIIPIDIEHNVNFLFRVGKVVEAFVNTDSNGKTSFHIKIELKNNMIANEVWNSISNPDPNFSDIANFGLSIKGNVEEYYYQDLDGKELDGNPLKLEAVYQLKKAIKVFNKVKLLSITITERPANKDTFLEAIERSIAIDEDVITIIDDNKNDNKEVIRMIDSVLKASDVIKNINDLVTEFVTQVNAVQTANLTAENVLEIIKMFAEKYENKIDWACCQGIGSAVDDTNEVESPESDMSEERARKKEVMRNDLSNELEQYKTNLVEVLNTKLSEIENININNNEVIRNDEQTESSDTTTSEGSSETINQHNERCKDSNQCTICKQEVVVEEVKEEIKEEVERTEQVETKIETIDYEEIARTIASSLISEKLEVIERTYNEKLAQSNEQINALNKEIEVLRNMPVSNAPNLISNIVERSEGRTNDVKSKLNNPQTRELTISDIMKSFSGRK